MRPPQFLISVFIFIQPDGMNGPVQIGTAEANARQESTFLHFKTDDRLTSHVILTWTMSLACMGPAPAARRDVSRSMLPLSRKSLGTLRSAIASATPCRLDMKMSGRDQFKEGGSPAPQHHKLPMRIDRLLQAVCHGASEFQQPYWLRHAMVNMEINISSAHVIC